MSEIEISVLERAKCDSSKKRREILLILSHKLGDVSSYRSVKKSWNLAKNTLDAGKSCHRLSVWNVSKEVLCALCPEILARRLLVPRIFMTRHTRAIDFSNLHSYRRR